MGMTSMGLQGAVTRFKRVRSPASLLCPSSSGRVFANELANVHSLTCSRWT